MIRARMVAIGACATLSVLASPAGAAFDDFAHGHWTKGRPFKSNCTTPSSSTAPWTCTYDFTASDCHETSPQALLGAIDDDNCALSFQGIATVYPTFDAAGRTSGCTTKGRNNFGTVDYTANFINSSITGMPVKITVDDNTVAFEGRYAIPTRHREWSVQAQFALPVCPKILMSGKIPSTGDMTISSDL